MASRRKHVSIGYEQGAETVKDNGILPSRALPDLKEADNAALALHLIPAGTPLVVEGKVVSSGSEHDIPEGHRFAVVDIAKGENVRSWGLAFCVALVDCKPGDYLCNSKVLATFVDRQSKLKLPKEPNLKNFAFQRHTQDKALFRAAPPVSVPRTDNSFEGFDRPGNRGGGTRNYVVILAVSSQAGSFARALERKFKHAAAKAGTCDGVVAVAHTEGGLDQATSTAEDVPNNLRKTIRTLAGFVVHPNVGSVLLVDRGSEVLRVQHVLEYMRSEGYPLEHVPHRTMTLGDQFSKDLAVGEGIVNELVGITKEQPKTRLPGSLLCLAQQCGGSDAFSGISANPLAGWIARALVADGGSALLAETDELIGAESYVLSKLADYETGDQFLGLVDRYYRYTNRFGHSPEGNPSGGNLYRGLYNITLKSIGAAMKKLPDVRLEHVVEYGERLEDRHGYCFMDSPGNDMESIAGQVASGCNVIMFTTGNGSITNFPFVPTIKVLTTTKRYSLLSEDMDVNGGEFLDGDKTLSELGEDTLDLLVRVCSGTRSKGERAGHHQVQLWRNWSKVEGDEADAAESKEVVSHEIKQESVAETLAGQNMHIRDHDTEDGERKGAPAEMAQAAGGDDAGVKAIADALSDIRLLPGVDGPCTERVGLVLPTSLCSSQVAQMMASSLNERLCKSEGDSGSVGRILALPHTEGCGHSSGEHETMVVRTILGYAAHPMVQAAVLLEHGCEKTHNDRMANEMETHGIDRNRFGYTSIQLDGGIDKASAKVESQLLAGVSGLSADGRTPADPSCLKVGFIATTVVPDDVLAAFSEIARALVNCGATVVAAGSVKGGAFLQSLLADAADGANGTLGYGQRAQVAGLHFMASSTKHYVELLTGLGGTGVEVIISYVPAGRSQPAHPLVPVILVSDGSKAVAPGTTDIDVTLVRDGAADGDSQRLEWAKEVASLVARVASRDTTPALFRSENFDFQVNRSKHAVSM